LLQLLWNLFKETGEINSYMFYKAIEESDFDESFTDDSDGKGSFDMTFEDKI
jgi:hypothetical protein